MPQVTMHPLLLYSQHDVVPGHCCPILWDLRTPPLTVRHILSPDRPLSDFELSQHATTPPVLLLRITCDVFPQPWPIEATNALGVTIRNVLEAVATCMSAQITLQEWGEISPKQQDRVNRVFDARWRASGDPSIRLRGILRVDCLLRHYLFSGFTFLPSSDDTCILTLGRPKP